MNQVSSEMASQFERDPGRLMPHRPPMVLLDSILEFDAIHETIVSAFTIKDDAIFRDGDGNVPAWAAIEYMAQTAACLVGEADLAAGVDASTRPGFLLGTRKLTLDLAAFERGRTYRVSAGIEFRDGDAASFKCTIVDDHDVPVATATLNAYRPADAAAFLKENKPQ